MATPSNESVLKAFRLLMLIASEREAITLGEAAEKTDMTVSTAHRFLKTLVCVGALERDDQKRYSLGSIMRQNGPQLSRMPDVLAMLSRHSESLCAVLRETVHVATFVDDMMRYIVKGQAPRSLHISTIVGTTLEAYCTGVGKAVLAHMPPDEVNRYLAGGVFYPLTPKTIICPDLFQRELEKIRACGYSIDDEEFETGLRCVAAPIFVHETPFAAISVSGPSSRIEPSAFPRISLEVMRTATAIGRELSSYGLDEQQIRFCCY